jgi:hypothetical protein
MPIQNRAYSQRQQSPAERAEGNRPGYRSPTPPELIHHRLHEYRQDILKDAGLGDTDQKGDANDDPAIKGSAQI